MWLILLLSFILGLFVLAYITNESIRQTFHQMISPGIPSRSSGGIVQVTRSVKDDSPSMLDHLAQALVFQLNEACKKDPWLIHQILESEAFPVRPSHAYCQQGSVIQCGRDEHGEFRLTPLSLMQGILSALSDEIDGRHRIVLAARYETHEFNTKQVFTQFDYVIVPNPQETLPDERQS